MNAPATPQLTIGLLSFSAKAPGDWSHIFNQAKAADQAGVDRLTFSDHVVFGEKLEEYARPEIGGQSGGKQPTGPDGHWLEPLTTMSVIAGMTTRIRLRTQILIAALRRPVVLAKSGATLDVLSGGRLDLGVGVGWQKEEYLAAGLEFEGRGRLLDHTLDVCQILWRDQRASIHTDELSFENIHQMPKPVQPGGVPIWISGTFRKSTVRRLARYGSRWIPWGPDAADLLNSLPRVKDAVLAAGGNIDEFQVAGRLPVVRDANGGIDIARSMEGVPAMVSAGITDFACHLSLPADLDACRDALDPLVTAFREATGRPAATCA